MCLPLAVGGEFNPLLVISLGHFLALLILNLKTHGHGRISQSLPVKIYLIILNLAERRTMCLLDKKSYANHMLAVASYLVCGCVPKCLPISVISFKMEEL